MNWLLLARTLLVVALLGYGVYELVSGDQLVGWVFIDCAVFGALVFRFEPQMETSRANQFFERRVQAYIDWRLPPAIKASAVCAGIGLISLGWHSLFGSLDEWNFNPVTWLLPWIVLLILGERGRRP